MGLLDNAVIIYVALIFYDSQNFNCSKNLLYVFCLLIMKYATIYNYLDKILDFLGSFVYTIKTMDCDWNEIGLTMI